MNKKENTGTLYLVATPIGNMEDITLRALRILKSVDVVAVEDTRHTMKLFSFYDIHTPLLSFREQNRVYQGEKLIKKLLKGENIALCSDAGLPLISDPGQDFVRLCIEKGIRVTVVPGPNAAISSLIISGLDARQFLFLGFPPRKGSKRKKLFDEIASLPYTLIFYESPNRILNLLHDLLDTIGDRKCALVRELTKLYEEIYRGKISEVIKQIEKKNIKGEITLVVEGHIEEKNSYIDVQDLLQRAKKLEQEGCSKREIAKKLCKIYKCSKRIVYSLLLEYM